MQIFGLILKKTEQIPLELKYENILIVKALLNVSL